MCWRRNGLQAAIGSSFSIGEFAAFFDGFHKLFLKSADRVETGAQIAMIRPTGPALRN